jgi:hypothetical protein
MSESEKFRSEDVLPSEEYAVIRPSERASIQRGNGIAWWPLLLLVDSCSGIRLPLVRTIYGTGKSLAVL